jgi:hypothetical protein
MLNLLESRFLASLRNDTKVNCDKVSIPGKIIGAVFKTKKHEFGLYKRACY